MFTISLFEPNTDKTPMPYAAATVESASARSVYDGAVSGVLSIGSIKSAISVLKNIVPYAVVTALAIRQMKTIRHEKG